MFKATFKGIISCILRADEGLFFASCAYISNQTTAITGDYTFANQATAIFNGDLYNTSKADNFRVFNCNNIANQAIFLRVLKYNYIANQVVFLISTHRPSEQKVVSLLVNRRGLCWYNHCSLCRLPRS